MLSFIQGEAKKWSLNLTTVNEDTGQESFLDLTGATEISVCFKSGTHLLTKLLSTAEITVDVPLEGKISGTNLIADTTAMSETTSGTVSVAVTYSATDVKKSIILNSHKVIADPCL